MGTIANFGRVMLALLLLVGGLTISAAAQQPTFAPGWTLQPGASSIRFQSVKKQTVIESSSFAAYSGRIDENGQAEVRVLLDSVDTKIDLRNVRMRFLFFETFKYPEAVVTTKLNPADFADLGTLRRKAVSLPFSLTIHGVTKEMTADLMVTQLADDMVAVSTDAPIAIAVADFGLMEGIRKLEEAANVTIVPTTTVTFDFVFRSDGSPAIPAPTAEAVAAVSPELVATPALAALEAEGDFDDEACKGRFEILSRSGNIYFGSGSSALDDRSAPLLKALADIIDRCPGMVIEVSGHTDSDGSDEQNLRLSEARAGAVARYLTGLGIPADRFVAVGRGETMPVAPNDSAENKARNRRIEFAVTRG